MLIILRSDNGITVEKSFFDMNDAAKWCSEYPEYVKLYSGIRVTLKSSKMSLISAS